VQQDETPEVAPVRRKEPGVEALDLPVLLELPVVLDGLIEDLDGLALAPPHDLAPPEKQRLVGHVALLGRRVTPTLTLARGQAQRGVEPANDFSCELGSRRHRSSRCA
jgi:hypothetical protein